METLRTKGNLSDSLELPYFEFRERFCVGRTLWLTVYTDGVLLRIVSLRTTVDVCVSLRLVRNLISVVTGSTEVPNLFRNLSKGFPTSSGPTRQD